MRVGIDIGGTFTDVVAEVDGRFVTAKVPSTRPDPDRAVSAALDVILERAGQPANSVIALLHGTTVATNAAIEGDFATVGLLTTAGFADVLAVGRQTREQLYDLLFPERRILVPEELRLEINERTLSDGQSLRAPSRDEVQAQVQLLVDRGAEVICVAFLNSYVNPEHELLVASWIVEEFENIGVWTSAEVAPEFREYERFSTAVLDAGLGPIMSVYLKRIEERVVQAGADVEPLLMHSAGGLATLQDAADHPTMTLLSGPAAGVLGSIHVAERLGRRELLTFDVGGTSTDLSVVHNGRPSFLRLRNVEGLPVLGNSLDIETIGAGGGSIAWVDSGGRLRVGPRSAGARPGPAAYGHGGTEPTVTDALVLTGIIPSEVELGSSVSIHYDAALKAMTSIAEKLGLEPLHAARAVLDVVNTNMSLTARQIIMERGLDPRDFVLVGFGGAGPLHAVDIARELGIREILIPATPGTMCALGLLVSDQESEFVKAQLIHADESTVDQVNELAGNLLHSAKTWTTEQGAQGAKGGTPSYYLRADMRYRGQHHALSIDLPEAPWSKEDMKTARDAFISAHRERNGYAAEDEVVEFVNLRVLARIHLQQNDAGGQRVMHKADSGAAVVGTSVPVWWDQNHATPTTVVSRSSIRPGDVIDGPALVFQEDTTIALPPGSELRGSEDGSAIIVPWVLGRTNASVPVLADEVTA